MPFNGSGTFTRLYSWVNDAAANIKIRADRMDNEMNGMSVGLSTCITKDGQTTITANLPMAGFRHTGVGDATTRTQYASFGQVQDGKTAWVDGGGTADAITASYSIPLTALVDGQLCYVRATAANATTTPTFSPSALTARTIVKNGGSALVAGDIAGDGHELILRYDLTNTRWELLNPKTQVPSIPYTAASSSGSASLQFAEDTDNGTNKVTLTAAASLAADYTVTLPSSSNTLATLDGTETLTFKTLTDPTINAAGGTLVLPQSSSPTPTAEGSAAWDTDDNRIAVGDGSGTKLFYPYETGSWTATATGAISTTVNCSYIKIGNMVVLTLPTTRPAGASSATPITLSGLPAAITPSTTVGIGPIPVTSGCSDQTTPGFVRATTSNTLIVYLNYALANFASSASTTGFYNTTLIYNIA